MKTILFVEDQIEFRAVHTAYLERAGYRVLAASDGESALEMVRAQPVDLILLDHSLPLRTGVEVAQELKRDPSTRDIPVIMVSAHSYRVVGRRAREAGCAAFLSKPLEPRRMLDEVRRFAA